MGQKYAVLIQGAIPGASYDEFWNDVVLMRETLLNNGFQDNQIYVLYGNGADYFNANRTNPRYRPAPAITDLAATIPNVTNVFNGLANGTGGFPQLTNEDLLFIWTFDHGCGPPCMAGTTNVVLCLMDGDMQDTTFANLVNQIPHAYLIICMQQCHSGGFINDLTGDRTVILTAATATEHAHGADTENETVNGVVYHHGEFNFYLFSALNGQTVTGTAVSADSNNNGFVTMREVFNYIQAHENQPETPQYDDGTRALGEKLNLSFADVFIRDNLQDTGQEPLAGGGISCSPDINHFRDQLANPQASLGSAAAKNQNNLFDNIEFGQTNYIYVRLQNRGYSTSDADVDIYWSLPSTLPTPGSWNYVGTIHVPAINPGDFKVGGPLLWSTVPAEGHYCFVAVLGNTQDPKPDINNVHSADDFYNLIRQNNNVTWKNFDVYDMFANSYYKFLFYIQGWPRIAYSTDLEIERSQLPNNVKPTLVLLKRLCKKAIPRGMTLAKETKLYSHYTVTSTKTAVLKNIALKTSDKSQATIEITLPKNTPDGIYQISVLQRINGKEMGRVSKSLKVGKYPYMGNSSTKELHKANCEWAKKISKKHKVAYSDKDLALHHGFNGCRFCLPEFDTDR
jgi:hypothetical protein